MKFESLPGKLPQLKIFETQNILSQNYSSGYRNVWWLVCTCKKLVSENFPGNLPKLEFKYFENW